MAVLNAWQRPSRVISTDIGNGSDGALTISSNTTEAPIDSSCSGAATSTSLSATNASFATGQIILIHQTRGTGVGQWEINKIASYTAGTITLSTGLQYTYTDSGNSQAQVRVLKQYSSVTVNSAITYTAKAWNQNVGGIIGWLCNGITTITGTVSGAGKGHLGATLFNSAVGANYTGEGTAGVSKNGSSSANGNGGGGGDNETSGASARAGAGGGGNGAAGTAGTAVSGGVVGAGGSATGAADLTTMTYGGGGGSVQKTFDGGTTSAGGIGGGLLLIFTKDFTMTGSISLLGSAGQSGNIGGGGGAGGTSLIVASILVLGTNLLVATAGAGGGSTASAPGGAGGVGRIAVHYKTSVSGTTNPTYNSQQDTTLKFSSAGGNFIPFL